MARMHGNIYEYPNGWFKGEIYNLLTAYCDGLDGHFTILFKDVNNFEMFKHGDYSKSLISYTKADFKGFMQLNEVQKEYIIFTVTK